MTLDELILDCPQIANLGIVRSQGVKLLLVLGWQLDDVLQRTSGRSIYKWSKPDGSWDGSRDVVEIDQRHLNPRTVMVRFGAYDYAISEEIKAFYKDLAEKYLNEKLIE